MATRGPRNTDLYDRVVNSCQLYPGMFIQENGLTDPFINSEGRLIVFYEEKA